MGAHSFKSLAPRFAALFSGNREAYGLSHGEVVRGAVTLRMYLDHLRWLDPAIGIFPIRPDNTCLFAAIDLDEPNFDLAADIADFLPGTAWIERSRSGNAHIWVFFSAPCPAWVARGQLKLALEAAGTPRVEVFPKQSELLSGMVGNYINLPFHGNARPIVWQSGEARDFTPPGYSLEGFIHDAEAGRIDPEHWRRLCYQAGIEPPGAVERGETWGERTTLHLCALYMLQHKEDNPLTRGHRHVVLFNLAKMLLNCRDYDEDEAETIVASYNEAGTDPVGAGEIRTLVKNAARGRYTSTGCDDPIMAPYISPTCPIANG